jgi:hypothetical protein
MQYGGNQGGGFGQPRQNKRMVMVDARKSYTNSWATDLMGAPCRNPGFCLYAACCNVCVAYSQRKEIMFNDLTNYTCCNGGMCISGRLGEKSCPEFCLCIEAFCCFPSAVATNRFMIQDEMRVENTQCDNFIIGFMLCLNQLACVFRIAAMISGNDEIEQIADILDCMSDLTYCTVCACMQTQQNEQLKMRDPNARPPPPHNPMAPPPQMHMQQMPPQRQPQYVQQAPPQMMQPQYPVQPQYPAQGYPAQGYPAQPQYAQQPGTYSQPNRY